MGVSREAPNSLQTSPWVQALNSSGGEGGRETPAPALGDTLQQDKNRSRF